MREDGFVLHGAAVWSRGRNDLCAMDDAYVVCVDGMSRGVFRELPEEYADLPVENLWDKLILPGFTDLHVHAPQYQFRGLGMDLELLDWLNVHTFPEEARYKDLAYAERAYDLFAEELYCGPTTRAVGFATADPDATLVLMDTLEDTGLVTFVGKVNMDRNVPDYYVEGTEESLADTRAWLDVVRGECEYINTKPILTPRFTPSCSKELLSGLGALSAEYGLPVQSHLSESLSEIEWVKELEPDLPFYGASYDRAGLFGQNGNCVMAHCVWSADEELALIKKNGVFVAHCPECNMNLSSGVAPVSRYLDMGIRVGLGSDVAGGSVTSIFSAMRNAVGVSKLRWRLFDKDVRPLTFPEVFYLATMGGGAFFGKVGSFEPGYEFDAVIIDDETIPTMKELTAAERAERLIYLADDRHVSGKIVKGRALY